LLDPDVYIDEVDHLCKVDPVLVAGLDNIADLELVADMGRGGLDNLTPMGWGEPIGNLIATGWGELVANLKPTGWGELANLTLMLHGEARPIKHLTQFGEPNLPTEAAQTIIAHYTTRTITSIVVDHATIGTNRRWIQATRHLGLEGI
jgi:hypothetical protein